MRYKIILALLLMSLSVTTVFGQEAAEESAQKPREVMTCGPRPRIRLVH